LIDELGIKDGNARLGARQWIVGYINNEVSGVARGILCADGVRLHSAACSRTSVFSDMCKWTGELILEDILSPETHGARILYPVIVRSKLNIIEALVARASSPQV